MESMSMVSHSAVPLDLNPRVGPAAFNGQQEQQQINPNFLMWSMEFKAAQESFLGIIRQMQQPDAQKAFLMWIDNTFIRSGGGNTPQPGGGCGGNSSMITANGVNGLTNGNIGGPSCNGGGSDGGSSSSSTTDYAADSKLRKIADDVRDMMPLNAILPTERITFPSVGENADCDPSHTLHVDAFLYDEDLVDELCDTGELGRNYCLDCSSHNTQPITYISHSASRERLAYIFRALLPPVPEDAVIVDVGSRLGAVLYGAYVYTKCRNIIGVELNEDLCTLQRNVVAKYNFQDRVRIAVGDVQLHSTIVNSADVLVLNNVFEFFMAPEIQLQVWSFLRATVKRGALLVTIPALQDQLQHFDVGFRLQDWVREVSPHDPNVTAPFDFQSETAEVKLYQVI